jgi:hypothetical protein
MGECNPDCDVERMEELRVHYGVQLDNIENALQGEEIRDEMVRYNEGTRKGLRMFVVDRVWGKVF